jgi:ADP-heptose:LPS heptosyltransferase
LGLGSDALKAADAVIGRAVVLLLAPLSARWSRAAPAGGPGRVLVIRPGGIGDAVLLFPMLRALREIWPGARLDVLVEKRNLGIFQADGLVDGVLRYDRPVAGLLRAVRGGYDVVIDSEQTHYLSAAVTCLTRASIRVGFATNRRRWMFTHPVHYSREVYEVYSFLELLRSATGEDVAFDPDAPFYPVHEEHRRWADEILKPLGDERLAVIHPGASTPLRRWDPARYNAVARRLIDRGLAVIVIGSAADRPAAARVVQGLPAERVLDLAGKANLMRAAAVIARATLYVSADTGPLHLAYGVGVPTVHLFGPGELVKWAPAGRRYRTVRKAVPCSPCTRYGHTPPCCHGVRCMVELQVDDVDRAVAEVLEA